MFVHNLVRCMPWWMLILGVAWWMLILGVVVAQQPITVQTMFFGNNTSSKSAYTTWSTNKGSFYDHAVFIPLTNNANIGAAIHWRIIKARIYIAVAARATGWVGFGIAEAGGMKGSDIVYYTASTNQLVDAHVLDVVQNGPLTDNCQNWKLRNGQSSGGFVIFEAYRSLDTGDPQDRAIINDGDPGTVPAHRVIAAWGDSQKISYHGTTNRVRSAVRFYGQSTEVATFLKTMKAQAEGSFEIRAINYQIKQQETEYKRFCFSRQALIALGAPDKSIQIIGWEPIVSKNAIPYVHHFLVYGSQDTNAGLPNTGLICDGAAVYQIGYAWAPGEDPFALPANVGAPYMGFDSFNSLQLEIHYNNPSLVSNVVDNSGVRFYYTSKLRDNDMFVYQYGDPFVRLKGTPVGSALSKFYQHAFSCPTSCSSLTLPGPVTVIREFLHIHKTGARAYNAQIRNGAIIRSGYVDFWEFAQQGSQVVVQQPFQVLPGDTFQTRCFYQPSDTTVFGLSSQQEMCIAFLFFYRPRSYGSPPWDACAYGIGFAACEENYTKQALKLTSQLNRVFGLPSKNCSETSTVAASAVPGTASPAQSSSVAACPSLPSVGWICAAILSFSLGLSISPIIM